MSFSSASFLFDSFIFFTKKRNIIFIIDTSVFLSDAMCIYKFQNNDIFIPLKVLEEIDKHKKRQDSVGINARKIIRILDELRAKGNLQKGIRLGKGKGLLGKVRAKKKSY